MEKIVEKNPIGSFKLVRVSFLGLSILYFDIKLGAYILDKENEYKNY